MCGTIRKSVNDAQAANYAVAYAHTYVDFAGDETEQEQDAEYRRLASNFIENFTPAAQRAGAHLRIEQMSHTALTTPVYDYWEHVID